MKNIILIIIFALTLFLGACQKEKIDNNINAVKITATNSSDETLKTAFIYPTVNWQANIDHIGLYSDKAYTTAPGVFATNVDYYADLTGTSSTFSSLTTVNWDGTTDIHNFYAYYPRSAGTPSSSAIPISLTATQTQVGATTNHIGLLDFEVATPVALNGVPTNNPSVGFTFNHVFAILKFDLSLKTNVTRTLTNITLTSPIVPILSFTTANIDITQIPTALPYTLTNVTGGGLTMTVNNNQIVSQSPTIVSVYMLVAPGDHTGQNMTVAYTNSLGATATFTKAGINFERGKVYTISQEIKQTGQAAELWP